MHDCPASGTASRPDDEPLIRLLDLGRLVASQRGLQLNAIGAPINQVVDMDAIEDPASIEVRYVSTEHTLCTETRVKCDI